MPSYLTRQGRPLTLVMAAVVSGPGHVDREGTNSPQAADVALGPLRRQGWQQLQGAGVALQQHLGDAGCDAEVAIDLEWSV